MTTNPDVAEMFRTIADLLDVLGEKFKPEAYRRAARSIESLTEDLRAVAERKELRTIPGVGEAIADKIGEYLTTGSLGYYEKLRREIPAGLVDLMRLPGIGPKTTRRFWVELGVEGPQELRDAIAAGRLVGMKGFGEKKIEQVRAAVTESAPGAGSARRPIEDVYPVARSLLATLKASSGVDRVEVAGSFRRARETVGDLDLLVTTQDPPAAFDAFTAHPLVAEVNMRGETKETVFLKGGFQVDLRVVKPAEFGSALLYFTGSKDHNIRLRSLARERGLKVNEYGVFRGEERQAGSTEEDVYGALGLAWIPPEIREDRGEIEAAAKGPLPPLVSAADLRGDLHVHLDWDARPADVDRLIESARRRKYDYVGVVVGASEPDGAVRTLPGPVRGRLLDPPSASPHILPALEAGPGTLPAALAPLPHEYRIVRPKADGPVPDSSSLGSRAVVAHFGASVRSDPAALARWIASARAAGAAVEAGPGPERLDSIAARQAREAGVPLHLPTGLLLPEDDPTRFVALGLGRRAGAGPEDVVNARAAAAFSGSGTAATRAPPKGPSSGPPRSPRPKARPA